MDDKWWIKAALFLFRIIFIHTYVEWIIIFNILVAVEGNIIIFLAHSHTHIHALQWSILSQLLKVLNFFYKIKNIGA